MLFSVCALPERALTVEMKPTHNLVLLCTWVYNTHKVLSVICHIPLSRNNGQLCCCYRLVLTQTLFSQFRRTEQQRRGLRWRRARKKLKSRYIVGLVLCCLGYIKLLLKFVSQVVKHIIHHWFDGRLF